MFFAPVARVIDTDTEKLIDAVVDKWGALSGTALSNWTHLPGSPWHQVYYDSAVDVVIPNELIQSYFKNIVAKNNQDGRAEKVG
jgi:uncharacterized phage-associated protein